MIAKPGDKIAICCDGETFEVTVIAIEAPDASGTYKLTCQRFLEDPALGRLAYLSSRSAIYATEHECAEH